MKNKNKFDSLRFSTVYLSTVWLLQMVATSTVRLRIEWDWEEYINIDSE